MVCCDGCPKSFCTACLAKNLSEAHRDALEDEDGEWRCPACDPVLVAAQQKECKDVLAWRPRDPAEMTDEEREELAQQLIDRRLAAQSELERINESLEHEPLAAWMGRVNAEFCEQVRVLEWWLLALASTVPYRVPPPYSLPPPPISSATPTLACVTPPWSRLI